MFHLSVEPDVAASVPQYTIQKAWWTSGNRAGLIAFALFALCVLFALRRAPFAIFSNPFFPNLHSDKLIWLHRWIGRVIWALVALHVSSWSVQLFNDRRSGTDHVAYVYAWHFQRFRFAWAVSVYIRQCSMALSDTYLMFNQSFVLFTLLILLSLRPIRDKCYDRFCALHIILVPATIVTSARHHPPLWCCWLALLLWAGERTWWAINWLSLIGFLRSRISISPIASTNQKLPTHGQGWEMHSILPDVESINPRSSFRSSSAASSKLPLYHYAPLSSSTHSSLTP